MAVWEQLVFLRSCNQWNESAALFVQDPGVSEAAGSGTPGWRHAILENKETDISQLTSSVGYRYFWSRADQVFLHPNAVLFITPEGRVARYLYGTAMKKKEVERTGCPSFCQEAFSWPTKRSYPTRLRN